MPTEKKNVNIKGTAKSEKETGGKYPKYSITIKIAINEKLEERQKIVKKEISSTLAKKETVKTKKNIFKKYRHIEELSIEIVEDFIDKILIGSYDETTNSRDIKIIWNFTI